VDAEVLRRVLERRQAESGQTVTAAELFIWHDSGEVDVIRRGEFLPALRTHVRATARALATLKNADVANAADGGRL
jgi:hypothetical protein